MASLKERRIYLVGGRLGVSVKMMAKLGHDYPELDIIGENNASQSALNDMDAVIRRIKEVQPDIVLVSMDTPEQERWIARYAPKLGASVVIGVGDLFEVCSGNIRRTSGAVRKLGLEGVSRSLREKGMFGRFWFGSSWFVVKSLFRALRGS